ncbi:hypothetical protein OG785_23275 [Streptomyces sp. NBC_00006]|uniref:hypothetical protein n=1 Tax=Streptomyces sp. NBC_00006 TaxID=2975619 RepID=UPI0022544FCD|nr:hypothetical protein [Streptomyces sp. NBC_00006]MCX5533463.1 hypothetical protein [Streptomyces sp. NBC_00006]
MPEEIAPQLVGRETVEGITEAWGEFDGRQFRDGTLRLVTRSPELVSVRTLRSSAEPRLFCDDVLHVPLTDLYEGAYVTPTRGGVAASRQDSVSYHSRDGAVEWSFRHFPWGGGPIGSGACAETPDGQRLLAVVPGTPGSTGEYPGDRCVLLESATGKVLDEAPLPSLSASYTLDAPFARVSAFFLSAGQGQDSAHSWKVDVADDRLHLTELASGLARVTATQDDRVLVQDVGGSWLQLRGVLPDGTTQVESEVRPEGLRTAEESYITGDSGFVDASRAIAAVGEEWWSEETEHFLLDTADLTARQRIRYPFPDGPDAKALGDGTWITVHEDEVQRWRIAP